MSEQKDTKPGMPEWLRTLLEVQAGGFRNARFQRCKTCEEIVLHGMDADLCAGMATVDPTDSLTPQQEHFCAITGRRTYSLDIDADRKVKINDRIRWALATPHPQGNTIVAEHRCGQRYSGFTPQLKKHKTTAAAAEPPF